MSWLRPLVRELRLLGLQWALKEIDPLHDDLPSIVIRRNELEADRRGAIAIL